MTQQDRINAARALGLHRWSNLRSAALKLALSLTVEAHWQAKNLPRVLRICDRFKVGTAFSFYVTNQELYWAE